MLSGYSGSVEPGTSSRSPTKPLLYVEKFFSWGFSCMMQCTCCCDILQNTTHCIRNFFRMHYPRQISSLRPSQLHWGRILHFASNGGLFSTYLCQYPRRRVWTRSNLIPPASAPAIAFDNTIHSYTLDKNQTRQRPHCTCKKPRNQPPFGQYCIDYRSHREAPLKA